MGIERHIRFGGRETPDWPAVRERLFGCGEPGTIRMIDGMPAFPDETPEAGWRELRVGTAGGMVTVRRTDGGFAVIVWGNAEGELLRGWDRTCWACAAAGEGDVVTPDGPLSAAAFAASCGLDGV